MLIDYRKVNVYQEDRLILKDVDLEVQEGEFIYIIGKVGSGKSSLMKTMYAELDMYEDEVEKAEVLGRDMTKLRRQQIPQLRREMGIIFQDFNLLHDRTVRRNLKYVLRATDWNDNNDIDERINSVLEAVGMLEKKESMPHELSGGEQQRVGIARALLNSPKIIIADEPTGNLDPHTAREIVGLLHEVTKNGATVIMSTHNWQLIKEFPGTVYECTQEGTLVKKG